MPLTKAAKMKLADLIKKFIKNSFIVFGATLVLFFALEEIFFVLGFPQGGSRFVEIVLIKNKVPLKKAPGEVRIFTYGESTMYGAHYGTFSSPARWLDEYLTEFLPRKSIRVVNFARLGCSSHFVRQTVRQTLVYQPDLMIFYVGHNGFLPKNTKEEIEARSHTFLHQSQRWLQKSRFFSELYRQILRFTVSDQSNRFSESKEADEIEVDPWIFSNQAVISRMDHRYSVNLDYLKENLSQIIHLAKKNHIPVVFLKPVCNLKDFAPSYSVHMKSLTENELNQWNDAYQKGIEEERKNNVNSAEKKYQSAYRLDSTHADLCYRLGQISFQNKNYAAAKKFFEEARDNDAKINRATGDILSIFKDMSKQENVLLVDTEEVLKGKVEGGILGEPVVEDNVHFSIEGHYLLGRALANVIADHHWIVPKTEWDFEREKPYDVLLQKFGGDKEELISAYLLNIQYFGTRFENRIRLAQKILKLDPNNTKALRHLAWAYWLNGETDLALKTYERLAETDPQSLLGVFRLRPQIKRACGRLRIPAPIGNM